MRIGKEHIQHYQAHGFTIIKNFLAKDELSKAQAEIDEYLPGWLDYAQNPSRRKPNGWNSPKQSRRNMRFPFHGSALNSITLHPELRRFASLMTGGEEIICEQSDLTYKCKGHAADEEQDMHLDFPNHTLAYAPDNPKYWQTAYLVYYTDVGINQAPTAICSWQNYQNQILWPSSHSRLSRPNLYEKEIKVIVPAGSVLIYSMRTFHRGTSFLRDGARIGQFISYAPKEPTWLGIVGWPEQGEYESFIPWMEQATPQERELIGFPKPDDDYWCKETLAGVSARYPNMEMDVYKKSLP